MDEVLRYRLALVERLHRKMRKYSIADGRATFRVEGLWEVSMAFGGENDDEKAEWYLLSIKFLFRVKDARGGEYLYLTECLRVLICSTVWSSVPLGPMKDHLIGLCNQELAKRPPTKIESESGEVTMQNDIPLIRGYNFLRE